MVEGFAVRHRVLLLVSWALVPILVAVGLFAGSDLLIVGSLGFAIVALSTGAMLSRGEALSSSATAAAVMMSACGLAYFSGDLALMSLALPVALVAAGFYRSGPPLLAGLVTAAAYLFLLWALGAHTVAEAGLQAAFLTLVALVLTFGWRLDTTLGRAEANTDRYWTSFQSSPVGMAVLKPSGEFLEVNASLAKLLGHESSHFPGRNIRAFVHGDDMAILGEAWEAIGNSRSKTYSSWVRCLAADGESIWGRASLALVPRTTDESAMVVLHIEDATSSRQETDRLERLLHGKDEFVAAVGSEIKAPLGTLVDLTSGDPVFRDINTHIREVASVVDDLVASARAETSPPEVVAGNVDVAATTRSVLDGLAAGDHVQIDVRASRVWADPHLTRQIVTGMLGNSLRYGGSRVRVQIFNSGPDTVVQVVDDGPAIPPAQQERIFAGDLRLGQPVTNPAAMGLSLTVAKYLAQRMEGDVGYRRTGDGFNVFELRLPSEEMVSTYNPRPRPRISSESLS